MAHPSMTCPKIAQDLDLGLVEHPLGATCWSYWRPPFFFFYEGRSTAKGNKQQLIGIIYG